ncbi:uncharacterized protein LOC127247338 isoform X2 [Andrographis paniculata]|uniref:uncharacterized protein LOC127247338 isoform X2 n=1 Tax=Andrographis paniculata TaxID=175694 RepID=UPI0021E714FA|nr:uncharacterized protein LOC127247338 isoform X2 [Andrographis paniculata]
MQNNTDNSSPQGSSETTNRKCDRFAKKSFWFLVILDRKYMFLICNGILAFLAKNVKFSNSSSEDGVAKMAQLSNEETAASSMENSGDPLGLAAEEEPHMEEQLQEDGGDFREGNTATGFVLETADREFDNGEEEDEDEDDEVEGDSVASEAVEMVSDARVSTEELNKKFEEFIRKMKEEIRVEAQQPLITVQEKAYK